MNLRQGFRYKFYAEYLQGFNNGGQGMYNAGLDFRHYQKVYRNVTFATRLAGAHSGGKQKIRYLMGGVDNWILPRQAGGPGNFSDNEYAFQALVTNMRGYEQSARIGNTFAVANLELRAPLLHTILRRPVQSPILRNLQLVGFLDAGSAWQGLLPSADQQVETYQLFDPSRSVVLNLEVPYDYGLAMGYGAGLRTMLFGYFLRADFAWNIEGRRKPILYVSMGTDF
jgi:outer membrane protein assembly factor BamA